MFRAQKFGQDNQQTNDSTPLPTVRQEKTLVARIACSVFAAKYSMGFDLLEELSRKNQRVERSYLESTQKGYYR
jgi:hypothetical protein